MTDTSTTYSGDPADAPIKDSAMIALLPTNTDWCYQDLPHMTLVYCGITNELPPTAFNEMAKDAAAIAMLSGPIMLPVLGVAQFGDVEKVNVLTLLATSEVLAMRETLDMWNASKFPFSPHATIGSLGQTVKNVPSILVFDRIIACYGEESLTFWLRR